MVLLVQSKVISRTDRRADFILANPPFNVSDWAASG